MTTKYTYANEIYETLFSAVNQNESQNSEKIYINFNLDYIF